MAGSRNRLWLGGRHPALPNLKRSLRRDYRGEKSLAHLEQIRLTPFGLFKATQITPNATNDKPGHRWLWKVGDAMATKVVAGPLRPKLRHCLLAANGIPAIGQ
jgi:hypothetical protein